MANLGYDNQLVSAGLTVTATGAAAGVEVDNRVQFRGASVVSAISGTSATITVSIDTSYDNGVTDAWRSVATFAAQTATGSSGRRSFVGLDRWVRVSWTVGGTTPSVTFGVVGEII